MGSAPYILEKRRRIGITTEEADYLVAGSAVSDFPLFSATWLRVDGRDVVFTGDMEGNVCQWQWSEENRSLWQTKSLDPHKLSVICVQATPDSRYLISASMDDQVRAYEVSSEMRCLTTIERPPAEFWGASISPDGRLIAIGCRGGKIMLHSIRDTLADPIVYETIAKFIYATAFSPDGKWLVAGAQDGLLYLFDVDTGTMVHSLTGHSKAVRSLVFSSDSKLVISGAEDRFLVSHSVDKGQQTSFFIPTTSWVTSAAVSKDNNYIISSSTDSKLRIWDVRNLKILNEVGGRSSVIWSVSLNEAGNRLVSVDDDGKIVVHDTDKFYSFLPRYGDLVEE